MHGKVHQDTSPQNMDRIVSSIVMEHTDYTANVSGFDEEQTLQDMPIIIIINN